MSQSNKYPIVLRFQGLFPNQLGRFQMHANRAGGDLSHVDETRTDLNETVMGSETWVEDLRAEIAEAAVFNHRNAIGARKAKHRAKEAKKIEEQGPQDPWKFTRSGPLREGILTVNAEWFGGAGGRKWDPDRVRAFRTMGAAFLAAHFGTCCVHARIDHDEDAMHFHFVLAPWNTKNSDNRGEQKLLQPSSHPLLADYELAQDAVGEFFEELGLTRGQTRAAERRVAKNWLAPLPDPTHHVPPQIWRAEEQKQLMEEAARQSLEEERLDALEAVLREREAAVDRAQKREDALNLSLAALGKGELVFRPGKGDEPDKLQFPERGLDPDRREEIHAALKLVHKHVLKRARVMNAAITAERRNQMEAVERLQSELARKHQDLDQQLETLRKDAKAVATELHRLHLPTKPGLKAILARYQPPENDRDTGAAQT